MSTKKKVKVRYLEKAHQQKSERPEYKKQYNN